jgi:hypothetical protein
MKDLSYIGTGVPRFNMIRTKKKPLRDWVKQLRLALFPYRDELNHWRWEPFPLPTRWEYEHGKLLEPGDSGYDEARYELGFFVYDLTARKDDQRTDNMVTQAGDALKAFTEEIRKEKDQP